jgi:hypothetical protein
MKILLLMLLSVSATVRIGSADTITAVTCTSPGAPYVINSSSCHAVGTEGYAQGNVATSVSLPSNLSGAAVIDANSTASAIENTIRGIATTATATSSANIGVTFDTTGPVRNGLLELTFAQLGWTPPVNGYTYESLSVASYSVNPDGTSFTVWIPIQLGTDFSFDYQQSLIAISSGLSSGDIDSQIFLLAFEANGATPVGLFDPPSPSATIVATPEPASMGLLMMASVAGVALLFKRRR